MKVTVKNILIGVVCIVIAQLLLVWLRSSADLPLADWLESGMATVVAVIVWFALVARFGDEPA